VAWRGVALQHRLVTDTREKIDGSNANKLMVFWKASTSSTKHTSPYALASAAKLSTRRQEEREEEEDVVYEMTALEIVVLVITFLAFIGQFVNLGYAIVDHQKIKKLTAVQSA
jgi:hypothetical protein